MFDGLNEIVDINQLTRLLTNPTLINNAPIVRSICNLCEILILAANEQNRYPDSIANNFLVGEKRFSNMPELSKWAIGKSTDDKIELPLIQPIAIAKLCEINLNFPIGLFENLRIDPSTRPSFFSLMKLTLKRRDGSYVPVVLSGMRHNDQVAVSIDSDGSLRLVITGNDPHLYFPIGFSFDSVVGCQLSFKGQPGDGPLELFFDFGQGFSRTGMCSVPY